MKRLCRMALFAIAALVVLGTLSSAERTATIVIDGEPIEPGESYTTRVMTLRFTSDGEYYTLNVVNVDEQKITFNVEPQHIPEHLNLTFDLSVDENQVLDLDLDFFEDISIRLVEIVTEETELYTHRYPRYSVAPITHKYLFDEPPDFFHIMNSYGDIHPKCPEEVSFATIQEKASGIASNKGLVLTDEDIWEMVSQCEDNASRPVSLENSFTIEGRPIEEKPTVCMDSLYSLLQDISGETYSSENLLEECEIRRYFNERFNEDTVEDYNATAFSKLFERRDKIFIEELTKAIARRNEPDIIEIESPDGTIVEYHWPNGTIVKYRYVNGTRVEFDRIETGNEGDELSIQRVPKIEPADPGTTPEDGGADDEPAEPNIDIPFDDDPIPVSTITQTSADPNEESADDTEASPATEPPPGVVAKPEQETDEEPSSVFVRILNKIRAFFSWLG